MQKFNEDSIRFEIHKLRCQLWRPAIRHVFRHAKNLIDQLRLVAMSRPVNQTQRNLS